MPRAYILYFPCTCVRVRAPVRREGVLRARLQGAACRVSGSQIALRILAEKVDRS